MGILYQIGNEEEEMNEMRRIINSTKCEVTRSNMEIDLARLKEHFFGRHNPYNDSFRG